MTLPSVARAHPHDLVLQDVLQRIHAMHTHVADRPATGQRRIGEPFARMRLAQVGKFGSRENRPSDLSRRNPLPKTRHAVFETKNVGDTQQHPGTSRRLDHPPCFACIHGHWLLAQHGLPVFNGGQHIRQMQRIRSRD
jgi:hypothetical protein